MFKVLMTAGLLAYASPAIAQDSHHSGTAYQDASEQTASLQLADTPELTQALAQGGEPIVAKVLGAVCDFCAKAMNKTFGKRDDVAAVYVDLDTKTLNLVMTPGTTLNDETLHKLVKKAGYKIDTIARGDVVTNS